MLSTVLESTAAMHRWATYGYKPAAFEKDSTNPLISSNCGEN